jgi:NAD(P)-dependent dehydrogenase (short-subunit alcohol dehydrogenase family)
VVREIVAAGGNAAANSDAVGTDASAERIVDAAVAAFGRVDILVNNAGCSVITPLPGSTEDDIERVMRINYWGPYMLMRRVWPLMEKQGYGRILNVMSNAVLGIGAHAPYASAKSGLVGLTTDAAIEGRDKNIRVNGSFPIGYSRLAEKSQEDHRRWMEKHFHPAKVAQAVAYLVSRDVAATGEIFSVGGGRVSRIAFVNNDGYFDPDLTPESIAEHIAQIRDLSGAVEVTSCMNESARYHRWCPWTGGQQGPHTGDVVTGKKAHGG